MAATTLGPNVKLGVIPFTVQWPVFLDHSFWIVLAAIASYGAAARALITRVLLERSSESEKDSGSD